MEKLVFSLFFFFFCNASFAAEIPDYSTIFAAQRGCDAKSLMRFAWADLDFDTSSVEIVSDPKIAEIPTGDPKSRRFEVVFTHHARMSCEETKFLDERRLHSRREIAHFEFDVNSAGKIYDVGEWDQDGDEYMNYLYGNSGFVCVVMLVDIIKSIDSFPFNKLCAGKSKSHIERFKHILNDTIQRLKAKTKP